MHQVDLHQQFNILYILNMHIFSHGLNGYIYNFDLNFINLSQNRHALPDLGIF